MEKKKMSVIYPYYVFNIWRIGSNVTSLISDVDSLYLLFSL